jgi:perosamine synthetase
MSVNGLSGSDFQIGDAVVVNEHQQTKGQHVPEMIPYAQPSVDQADIAAVSEVLQSSWLTTGPKVDQFESDFAKRCGSKFAVAVSSGTAALHAAMYALGIEEGDEVIVPAITFVATANCVLFRSATPVFADVTSDSLLIDVEDVNRKVTSKTRAIIAVDYAGQPADWPALRQLSYQYKIPLISDACHSLGATFGNKHVGQLADMTCFSTHAIKAIATGEGGMVATNDESVASSIRCFRNHGITSTPLERESQGAWHYEMQELGYNYRMSDIHCALGISQLRKLDDWLARRRQIAARYDAAFSKLPAIKPLIKKGDRQHAYHLYVIRLDLSQLTVDRDTFIGALRSMGVGASVHYPPVYLHPYYRDRFGYQNGHCPKAERGFNEIISLPMFPGLTEQQIATVINSVQKAAGKFAK